MAEQKRCIFSIIICLVSMTLGAQPLVRKGSLGARISFNADSTAVLIQEVLEGSTAEKIGLKEGFHIVRVNGRAVSTPNELVQITATWREGDDVQIDVQLHDIYAVAQGQVVPKPKERSDNGQVEYGEVDFENNTLRSILVRPNGVENPPVLFYLQGYGCASQDYYHSRHPVKEFVEDIVSKGIAVFRMEKPGIGDSSGELKCEEIGYHIEVDAFTAGLKTLKGIEGIDSSNVFLFGHSLGGVTAPQLAARIPVKGVVNYGSVSTSWYEYMMKMIREQSRIFEMDYAEIQERVKRRGPLLHAYLVEQQSLDQLKANPEFADYLSTGLPWIMENGTCMGRDFTFMPEINRVDITMALREAGTHVLALQGEFDIASIDEEWAEYEAAVVNQYHPGKGSWAMIEQAEHGLARVESREEQMSLREAGDFTISYMAEHYHRGIGQTVYDWMKDVMQDK